jgi:hypothetical protein
VYRAQCLQRHVAEARDDLLLGKLAIAFRRLAGESMRAAEPCPQIFGDGNLAWLDQCSGIGGVQ